jgi:hypothetical protein
LTTAPSFRNFQHVPSVKKPTHRWWGYFVWVGAGLMLAVPEITAMFSNGALGFVTASETIGHIERYHNWVELGFIGTLVLIVSSLYKVSVDRAGEPQPEGEPTRTRGGRLTFHSRETPTAKHEQEFEDEDASLIFAASALVSAGLIALGGWAATHWWDDPRRFHASFVIYVSVAMLWFVIPSLVALFTGNDVPYPTMVRTVQDGTDWLKNRTWPLALGPKLAWTATFVILWGLAILFVHLTLYPYPNITHILNPSG